jgi:DNA-binding XRE family transcriptional regulator
MWEELRQWPMTVKLRVVRALVGTTQGEQASLLAVSLTTYQGWESGARPIPYRVHQWLNSGLEHMVMDAERAEDARRQAFVSGNGAIHAPLSERAGSRRD